MPAEEHCCGTAVRTTTIALKKVKHGWWVLGKRYMGCRVNTKTTLSTDNHVWHNPQLRLDSIIEAPLFLFAIENGRRSAGNS